MITVLSDSDLRRADRCNRLLSLLGQCHYIHTALTIIYHIMQTNTITIREIVDQYCWVSDIFERCGASQPMVHEYGELADLTSEFEMLTQDESIAFIKSVIEGM